LSFSMACVYSVIGWRDHRIKGEMKGVCEVKAATIQVETLTCPSCLQKIEAAVKGVEGVDQATVKVLFNSSKVKLDFDDEKVSVDQIAEAITKVGYEVLKSSVR